MAHYAKISNQEFTVSERARLQEAQSEKTAIIASNMATEEYAELQEVYRNSFTSETLQTLESEMDVLKSDDTLSMTDEEKTAHQTAVNNKQSEIDAEKAALIPGQETALANLTAKQQEGTETLTAEIETLNTTISNSLARVTAVYTGVDEIEMVSGDTSALEAEIKVLEESKKDYPYNPATEEPPSELIDINSQIQEKVKQIAETPLVEKDNTVFWEGYIGSSKRTSYNTRAGDHLLGGTPFRKNYAGIGMIYDPVRDAFYGEQPYASWILNEDTCEWEPPIAQPDINSKYWNEVTQEWLEHPNKPFTSWIYGNKIPSWNGYFAGENNIDDWFAPTECPDTSELSLEKPVSSYYWNEDTLTWVDK